MKYFLEKNLVYIALAFLISFFGFGLLANGQECSGDGCTQNSIEVACSKINSGIFSEFDAIDKRFRNFADSYNDNFSLLEFDIMRFGEIGVQTTDMKIRLKQIERLRGNLSTIYDSLSRDWLGIREGCGDGEITLEVTKFRQNINDYSEVSDMIKEELLGLRDIIEKI